MKKQAGTFAVLAAAAALSTVNAPAAYAADEAGDIPEVFVPIVSIPVEEPVDAPVIDPVDTKVIDPVDGGVIEAPLPVDGGIIGDGAIGGEGTIMYAMGGGLADNMAEQSAERAADEVADKVADTALAQANDRTADRVAVAAAAQVTVGQP